MNGPTSPDRILPDCSAEEVEPAAGKLCDALGPCGCDCDPATLLRVYEALDSDRTFLIAIEMAVVGLGDEFDCSTAANAVAELVRTLQRRLDERSEQLDELLMNERDAEREAA